MIPITIAAAAYRNHLLRDMDITLTAGFFLEIVSKYPAGTV